MTKTTPNPKNIQKEKKLHSIIGQIINRSKHRLQLLTKHILPSKIFLLPIINKCVNDLLNKSNYFQSQNVLSTNSLIIFFQQPEYLEKIINSQVYMYTENIFDFIEKHILPHICCVKYSYKDDIPWFLSFFHCTPWKTLVYNLLTSPIFISQQISVTTPVNNTTSSIVIKNNCIEVIRHIPLDVSKCYDISSIFIRQKHDLQILTSNLREQQLLDIQHIDVYLDECNDKLLQNSYTINIKATFLRDEIDKYIDSTNVHNDTTNNDYIVFCDDKLKYLLSRN